MKTSNLHKTQNTKDDEDDEDEEESEENQPRMDYASIAHYGCINRIRVINSLVIRHFYHVIVNDSRTFSKLVCLFNFQSTIANNTILAASWSELGKVYIWDLKTQIQAVNDVALLSKYRQDDLTVKTKPIFTFSGHQSEGFALDWCPTSEGF